MRPLLFSQPRRGQAGANISRRPGSRRGGNQARLRGLALGEQTRGFDPGSGEDEDVTVDAGPVDAGPVDAGPRPPDAGPQQGPDAGAPDGGVAAPANNCAVASGPSYTPTGSVPVSNSGGRKSAAFSMAATFSTAAATGATPSCCEVRQFIKWDARYAASKGGPPHSGFPASTPAGTWIEDRDTADTRYGHRSGVHSAPSAGCGDEYLLGGRRNQASGDTYCGSDNPGAPSARVGSYQFQLKVIDSCTGAERATSSIITVNWG